MTTPEQREKIELLQQAQRAEGEAPRVAELLLLKWPDPDGPIYYGTRIAADLLDTPALLDQLDGPIELRLTTGLFLEVDHDAGIADDSISLEFWDGDGEITRLALTHGAGIRAEVFYYFPETDLLLSEWFGHLQPPTAITFDRVTASVESGFRSSNLPLPARGFFTGCQAVFGGLLETQAEIDEGDCPYNLQLAGPAAGALPTWSNILNGTPGAGGEFLKTAGGADWNCGASHGEAVAAGDASMRATFAGAYSTFGFFTTATPTTGNAETWACFQANPDGSITIKHSGTLQRINAARYTVNSDNFEIQLRAGLFHFYKNGTELVLSDLALPPIKYPLYLGVAIYNEGAGLHTAAVALGDIGSAPAFGNLDPATGQPFTDCPRNNPAACIARLGDSLSYLAFDTVAESHLVNETKGPNITVTSRGNETNLKRPLRVIAGQRHVSDLDLLAFVVEPDTRHPDEGSVKCLFAASEGPNQSITNGKINSLTIAPQHSNYRNGDKRQGQTSFSPNILNYNGTSLFLGVAQGDFTKAGADDLRGEVDIEGLRNVRRYSDPDTFLEEYSSDRAWWLLHMMRNKRWGHGLDAKRVNIQDFIDLALWASQIVAQKDKDGNQITGPRTRFNAELIDRTAQQQINDLCSAGRFGLPFPHRGLLRVLPLRRADELFSPTVFTDKAFWGALNRQANSTELSDWLDALFNAREISQQALLDECRARIAGLFHSAEYTARARTDEQFIGDCYHAYLRRDPEQAGLDAWLAVIGSIGRDGVLDGFAGSQEFINDCQDQPVTTFSDRGSARNICLDQPQSEGGRSTLAFSMQSDADLCNRLVLTFDDETQAHKQIPLTFEDITQQLKAGRAFGDTSRRSVEKQYPAFGVTTIGEAGRLGNLVLDLGEFDDGGLKNNLRADFVCWYLDAVELHKYQIIKLESDKLDSINTIRSAQDLEPFEYFRIRSIKRQADLKVAISAQVYPREYYDRLEFLTVGPELPPQPPGDGGFNPEDPNGPGRGRLPFTIGLSNVTHTADQVTFTIGASPVASVRLTTQ
jgi:hypothetical protein